MTAATEIPVPRLKTRYRDEIVPQLTEAHGYANPMQVPKLVKIVVNMGVGQAAKDAKLMDGAVRDLSLITGQKPLVQRARKSIAQFKLREGMPIGAKVTLRGDRMWEFLDRLLTLALPRIRDFRGLSSAQFDGRGNYTFGLTEQSMFHEIDPDTIDRPRGMDITWLPQPRPTMRDGPCCARSASRSRRADEWRRRHWSSRRRPSRSLRSAAIPAPALRTTARGVSQVRPVPNLRARAGPRRRIARRYQGQLVVTEN